MRFNRSTTLSEADVYANAERAEKEARDKERDMLLDREEAFQREILGKKLASIDKLSESICTLALAIEGYKPAPRISINIDPNTTPENLKAMMEEICKVMK